MSLTKKSLLERFGCGKPQKLGEFFGLEIWVKPPTEVTRSRRAAQLFNRATGEIDREALRQQRIYSIIDAVCDSEGNSLFTDADFDDLSQLDSFKIDKLNEAIGEWMEKREGNEEGESSD